MQKPSWFPFYGRDFFGDEKVKMFNLRQIGIYITLLWHQWEEGSIPSLKICHLLPVLSADKLSRELSHELTCVYRRCFTPHPTLRARWINPRLEQIRAEQAAKYESFRARGAKGGRGNLASPATAEVKLSFSSAKAEGKQSDSDSSSSSFHQNEKTQKKLSRAQRLADLDAFSLTEELRDWARVALHIEIPPETLREFKDYWRGQRTLRTDWDATFKNRLRDLVARRTLTPVLAPVPRRKCRSAKDGACEEDAVSGSDYCQPHKEFYRGVRARLACAT